MAGESFFGFNTQMPSFEDEELEKLDPTLKNLDDDYDLLNEDTFGSGALEDDWEIAHKKLAGIDLDKATNQSLVSKNEHCRQKVGVTEDDDDDEANLEQEEEILEQTLAKLVDEDDDTPKPYTSSGYKDIPPMPSAWNGSSPLSSPTSATSLQELISPSSNIWASPDRVNKERVVDALSGNRVPYDRKHTPGRRPYSPAFEDDAIIKAMPKPENLLPPSSFIKKPPVNAIRLEDLEKEFSHNTPPRAQVDPRIATPSSGRIRPPPGIPHPLMTPQGYMQGSTSPNIMQRTPQGQGMVRGQPHPMMTPQRPPSPNMMRHTPQGPVMQQHRPYPMPPQMFQGRQMAGKHPLPSMGSPIQGFMRTPPPQFQRPPVPMMHSDPAHLMHHGNMMNYQMNQRHRYSTPQPHPNQYRNFPNNRNQYDRNFQDRRGHYLDDNRHVHQQTDLEKKIHEILTCDEHMAAHDPYAGLMTRREKEWIIKIQLLQLTSSMPDLDDFYFQTYIRRKQAKERAKQGEMRDGENTTQMALPQFQREERNYKPLDFQGTLGKVSASSVSHPRQMVAIDHISKASEQDKQSSSSTKDIKRRRQILSAIEKAYEYLLQLDDLERKITHVHPEERNSLLEAQQSTGLKLFNLLKLNIRSESIGGKCDEEYFVQLMSVRKGKVLLSRVLPALKQPQAEAVLLALTRNVISVIKKDSQDEVLPLLITPVSRVVDQGSSAVLYESLRHMVYADDTSALHTILPNQFGASLLNSLLKSCSSLSSSMDESMGDFHQLWEKLVSDVVKEFHSVPVTLLAKNVLAITPFVGTLCECTSPDVSTSLQEHYRNAILTKEESKK
ncbi:protein PAT1 homolog 1 isoform X1 [Nematostella vectensis]|uniref:protein PAT1 homolog 1 isoform X1 n=1 Tax=Nematostella vectensis TaxID=45351 RepID=UPI0020772625|nr:protein PAT1 homolog 1 isoform X1 [Nematostella vectensis]